MTDSMVDAASRIASPEDLTALQDQLAAAAEGRRRVLVCSTGCLAIGAREVEATFRSEVAAAGLIGEAGYRISPTPKEASNE